METADAPARSRRLRGTLGATLVEYAVILAIFAVPAVGASAYLTTKARGATTTNADCISTRPPPAACQAPTITTSTTATTIATTTTTIVVTSSSSSTSSSSTTAAPIGVAAWGGSNAWNTGTNVVTVSFTLTTSPGGTPIVGATANIRFYDTASKRYGNVTCTTNASGVCSASYTLPVQAAATPSGTTVSATITSVDSTPSTPSVPNSWTSNPKP